MRPEYVATCLEHIGRQTYQPTETIVVDASTDARTAEVVRRFPGVRYLRNDHGAGTLATSRAIALEAAKGDVIAFLDDDAFARSDWLQHLVEPYVDEEVAAVGGRALNGQPDEETTGLEEIGRLLPDGRLTGHFAADPGRPIEVDHMLGANMSLRTSVARALGGIHDHYPGTCLREDADMPLRMRMAGYRVVFAPQAIVEHVAAPYEKGQRFDLRYTYYAERNHLVLLSRTVGVRSPYFRNYLRTAARGIRRDVRRAARALAGRAEETASGRPRAVVGGLARASVRAAGLVSGSAQVLRLRWSEGSVPAGPGGALP
jgi:GT2 family glycosyltransferase